MKVKIAELRKVSEILFKHLEDLGHEEVSIKYDYYWNFPKEIRYDVSKDVDPDVLDLGQLSDDLESLREIALGNSPPISYGLVWLAEIIRPIGEDLVA